MSSLYWADSLPTPKLQFPERQSLRHKRGAARELVEKTPANPWQLNVHTGRSLSKNTTGTLSLAAASARATKRPTAECRQRAFRVQRGQGYESVGPSRVPKHPPDSIWGTERSTPHAPEGGKGSTLSTVGDERGYVQLIREATTSKGTHRF